MKTEKEQDWLYQCFQCEQAFQRPEAFQKHMKSMHLIKISACRHCPSHFEKLSELFLHARQIHNIEKRENKKPCRWQCRFPECTYQTDNGGLMKHHFRSHTNYKPHKCEICNKSFTQKSNMKTHFNRHKKNQFNFECKPCERVFNSHDILLSHLETREHMLGLHLYQLKVEFECMKCQKIFDNPTDTYNHGEVCKSSDIHQIACQECNAYLPLEYEILNEHDKLHRNKITCPYCKHTTVTFTDKMAFNFHLTKKHQEKVDRRKACRYCEQIFISEEARLAHIKLEHPNQKNRHRYREPNGRIKCEFENCLFSSNSEIQLQKHWNVHYKDLKTDDLYKNYVESENDVSPNANTRKRGRPRLCDTSEISEISTDKVTDIEIKKRGRPRKSSCLKDESINEFRKRGRPKKEKLLSTEKDPNFDFQYFYMHQPNQEMITDYPIDHIDDKCFTNITLPNFDYIPHDNPMIGLHFIKEEEIEVFDC